MLGVAVDNVFEVGAEGVAGGLAVADDAAAQGTKFRFLGSIRLGLIADPLHTQKFERII